MEILEDLLRAGTVWLEMKAAEFEQRTKEIERSNLPVSVIVENPTLSEMERFTVVQERQDRISKPYSAFVPQ